MRIFKKADIILLILLAAAGIVLAAVPFAEKEGNLVVVKAEGKLYGTYELFTDREVTIEDGEGRLNRFVIENGTVRMTEASCRNHDCIQMGAAADPSKTIVCLPNRVSIHIEGGEADVDVVSG